MDINNDNINEIIDKYITFVDRISDKYNYSDDIKHVLYLMVPAFVIKYGFKDEQVILSCFENTPINIKKINNVSYSAYFNRALYKENDVYKAMREVVVNKNHNDTLINLLDSIIHEFNHAVNSYKQEITWNEEVVSLRTGLSHLYFYKEDINKLKEKSKDVILEEVINTRQTETIIDIINSFNNYEINNNKFSNALYSLKHEINNDGYKSRAYYLQSYICQELMKNKTFISTVENLRFQGNIDDIEYWFDSITNTKGSYLNLINLLDEILKREQELLNVKLFKKYKINKLREKSRMLLDIVKTFENNCIYK